MIDPCLVVQIPLHGFADTGLEGFLRLPAQFLFQLTRIDGVTAVVARAILHEGDLCLVALPISTWLEFVEDGAEGMHDVEVGLFVPTTDVIGFTQLAGFEHTADSTTVVFDVEPVADLLTITVDRQRFAVQCVKDTEGDKLFREVIRPVVVRTVSR